MSSGGLVTGLSGLSKTTTFQWYGWPGLEIPEAEIEDVTTKLKDEFNAVPVFMADDLADRHYNGFSSESIAVAADKPLKYSNNSQIPSCGLCSIITQARSPLTNRHGKPTKKQIASLLAPLPKKYKMAT